MSLRHGTGLLVRDQPERHVPKEPERQRGSRRKWVIIGSTATGVVAAGTGLVTGLRGPAAPETASATEPTPSAAAAGDLATRAAATQQPTPSATPATAEVVQTPSAAAPNVWNPNFKCQSDVEPGPGGALIVSVHPINGTKLPTGARIVILGTNKRGQTSLLLTTDPKTEATYKPHSGDDPSTMLVGVAAGPPAGSTPDQPGWTDAGAEATAIGGLGDQSKICG